MEQAESNSDSPRVFTRGKWFVQLGMAARGIASWSSATLPGRIFNTSGGGRIVLRQFLTDTEITASNAASEGCVRGCRMRTEELADGSRLSAATRYESLVGVLNAIGTHRNPQ